MFPLFYFSNLMLFKIALTASIVSRFKSGISPILALYVSILYLLGMYRSAGVDISSYRRNYENVNSSDIFDPGYNTLMYFFNYFNLSFEIFLLFIGFLNLLLIRFCCSKFNVKFGIVLAILALHLFIVRDFSQVRVSLAVNFVIAGFLCRGIGRYIFYTAGASVHFTSIVLIGLFFSYNFQKKQKVLIKVIPLLCVLLVGSILSSLSFLDPRIDIYLNWDREDYGQSVNNYTQMFLILYFMSVSMYRSGFQIDIFVYSFVFSLVVFFSFSQAAIFSYRLANVCMSLYPFMFAKLINSSKDGILKLVSLASLIVILSLREGNIPIIQSIVLGFE